MMKAIRQTAKTSSQVLNRKPDVNSLLAPPLRAVDAQGPLQPVQARFGHDFSRLALTADSVAPMQREAPEEKELQMKADSSATVQRTQSSTQSKPNATGLPDTLKSGVENLSAMSCTPLGITPAAQIGSLKLTSAPVQRVIYLGKGSVEKLTWAAMVNAGIDSELAKELNLSEAAVKSKINSYLDIPDYPYRFADKDAMIQFFKGEFSAEISGAQKNIPPQNALTTNFNESNGDKVYGLKEPRKQHIKNLYKYSYVDAIHSDLGIKATPKTPSEIQSSKMSKEVKRYGRKLHKHPKYKPLSNKRTDPRTRVKGACKFGIEYTTKTKTAVIHFELANIDMAAIIKREGRSKSWGITDSELRSIYREVLRAKKNAADKGRLDLNKIQFYMNGQKVDPPWIQEPELWEKHYDAFRPPKAQKNDNGKEEEDENKAEKQNSEEDKEQSDDTEKMRAEDDATTLSYSNRLESINRLEIRKKQTAERAQAPKSKLKPENKRGDGNEDTDNKQQ